MTTIRVLVIDDDPAARSMICAMLRSGGYMAAEAPDGRRGLESLVSGRFDLVVTDLLMPIQDGIETIAEIRELDPILPIIAISGSRTETFSPLQDAKLMGADHTIAKPIDVGHFLGVVNELTAKPGV